MITRTVALVSALLITINGVACHSIGIGKRQQSDAVSTPVNSTPLRPLPWGDVNFIHTTDTHGWLEGHVSEGSYNGDLGDFYSFTIKMKQKARKLRKDLFVVDTGDTHDGSGLSDVTSPKGRISLPLLKKIPYDLLTIGNHELYVNDVTVNVVENFIPHWKDRYLASNVYFKDLNNNKTVPIGAKYTYFKGEFGTKVLAYGFLFDFRGSGNMSVVQKVEDEVKQEWFLKSLKKHKPDVIALIGHIAIRFNEFRTVINAIRQVYPTIPIAVLGGHTHTRNFVIYDNWAAGIESGRYMETIGFFSLDGIAEKNKNVTFSRRYLDQNRDTYIFHSVNGKKKHFDTKVGRALSNKIYNLRKEYNLSARLGCVPQDYKLYSVPSNDTSSVFHLLNHEVIPKVVADKKSANPPYVLYNTGGVRYDIFKGVFTIDNMYQLAPFDNKFYCIKDVPLDIVKQILPKLNKQGELKRKRDVLEDQKHHHFARRSERSPGYVTKDDLGTDGDDTVHSPIPYYPSLAYVSNDVPSAPLIDVIYLDFFDKQLRDLLSQLSGKNWTAIQNYTDVTSSSVWVEYAKTYWNTTGTCA